MAKIGPILDVRAKQASTMESKKKEWVKKSRRYEHPKTIHKLRILFSGKFWREKLN
jgi:hypothetical protein